MTDSDRIDFHFNGGPVGALDVVSLPTDSSGTITYMPYRSGSHFLLHQAIADDQQPKCTFTRDGVDHEFVVDSFPDYGHLAIRDFRQTA